MSRQPSLSIGIRPEHGAGDLHPSPSDPATRRSAPGPEFSIAVGRAMGTVVVTVHGEIDTASVRHLEQILEDLIENQENMRVVVDLRDVAQLDAAGVTALLVAANRAHQHGGAFSVNEPSGAVYDSLKDAGVAEVIPISSHHPRASRASSACAPPPYDPVRARHPSSEPNSATSKSRSHGRPA